MMFAIKTGTSDGAVAGTARMRLHGQGAMQTLRRRAVVLVLVAAAHLCATSASASEPQWTAAQYREQGGQLLREQRFSEAVDQFTQAISREPDSARDYALRALAHQRNGNPELAAADMRTATGLHPTSLEVLKISSMIAEREHRYADQLAALSTAHRLAPDDLDILVSRAIAYGAQQQYDAALADIEHAARLAPADFHILWHRAGVFYQLGNLERALDEYQQLLLEHSGRSELYEIISDVQLQLGAPAKAMEILNRGLATVPTADMFMLRAQLRSPLDFAGREHDITAALALADQPLNILISQAQLEMDRLQAHAALALYNQAMLGLAGDQAEMSELLVLRAVAFARLGDLPRAQQDLAQAQTHGAAMQPTSLNNAAWNMAIGEVLLPSALALIDQALERKPASSTYHGTRAMVLLRMNRYPEAVTAFDTALTLNPGHAHHLFGRAIARERNGQLAAAQADLQLARATSPEVEREYAHYGIRVSSTTPN
jgi:tetratricopeptide (TPR) repeat protein